MAHKKGQGSSRNGRDSPGQARGVKTFGGEFVVPGNIIIRQRGAQFGIQAQAMLWQLGYGALLAAFLGLIAVFWRLPASTWVRSLEIERTYQECSSMRGNSIANI